MDYFAPAVVPLPPSRPLPSPPLPPAPPSGRPYVLVCGLVLALVVVAVVLSVRRVQAAAVGGVFAVTTDATSGWGPTWVDERGRPARWDPCTPIRYVVQAGWVPEAGRADLAEALRRLSAASGLQFTADGDTTELPALAREPYQPGRYGERWAPLLIGWVPAASTDLGLGAGVQGVSRSVAVAGRDGASIVSGQVVLDASHPLAPGFGPGTTDGEVLLHELAHAVGLGHVLDPTQVMYPQTSSSESAFGAGDRAGLAAVGAAAGCRTAPGPA